MADQFDQDNPLPGEGEVPVEDTAGQVQAPRRAASAEFVVNAQVGSEAALREAMDPAHQSLTDALRLSYKVLQFVILVLIALFLVSGCQTVQEGYSGVKTYFGAIQDVGGKQELDPGLQTSLLPYPAGQFVLFPVDNREVNAGHRYWPALRGLSLQQAQDAATLNDVLRPGESGYVLTRSGDIAHIQAAVRYQIDNPVDFVKTVENDYPPASERLDADRLVSLILEKSIVHVAGSMTLQEIVDDQPDYLRDQLKARMQESMVALGCGITITDVTVSNAIPPLAVRKVFENLQQVEAQALGEIQTAEGRRDEILLRTAGENYYELVTLIDQYEVALDLQEQDKAEQLLQEIGEFMESDRISGQVSGIIEYAKAFQSQIEDSLGNEARRFSALYAAFQENPEVFVQQRWTEVYTEIITRPDAEVFYVPHQVGALSLNLSGLHFIGERRQKLEVDRRNREALMRGVGDDYHFLRGWEMATEGPGRQLWIDEQGNLRGLGDRD